MVNKMNVIKINSKNEKKHQNCQKTLLPTKKKHCRSGLF